MKKPTIKFNFYTSQVPDLTKSQEVKPLTEKQRLHIINQARRCPSRPVVDIERLIGKKI